MQRRFLTLLYCSSFIFIILPGNAQMIESTPCGWARHHIPAQSESRIGATLEREPVWEASIASMEDCVLFPDAMPAVEASAFAPSNEGSYYVRFRTGTLAGRIYRISESGEDFLTLDHFIIAGEELMPGERFEIIPYWTLGTLYPARDAGVSFTPSASSLVRQTELLLYDSEGIGMNRAPIATYYFFNGAWRKVGAPVTQSFDAIPIPPHAYLLQRNKATATALTYSGMVATGPRTLALRGNPSTKQDHHLTLPHPVPVTLRESGLAESGGFQPSASSLVRGDELLLFDPAQTGFNQAPVATYYHLNGGWRRLGSPVTSDFSDNVTLPHGGGFILRKASGQPDRVWTFVPNL